MPVLQKGGAISTRDVARNIGLPGPIRFSELAKYVNVTRDDRNNEDTTLTLSDFYDFSYREVTPACSVYLTSHFSSSGSVINFGGVEYDAHDNYNTSDGAFTAPASGVYLVALGGYTRDTSDVPFELLVNGETVRKVSVYDIAGSDSRKRNGVHFTHVVMMRAGDMLQAGVTSSGGQLRGGYGISDIGRNGYMQVSLLRDATKESCAFTAYMGSGRRSFDGKMEWDNLLFDLKDRCWSASDNAFIAPVDGVYCFSVGGHVRNTTSHVWTLKVNGSRARRYSPYSTVSWSDDQDMGQCMAQNVQLSQGDEVHVEAMSSTPLFYGSDDPRNIGDAFFFSGALLRKSGGYDRTSAFLAFNSSSRSNRNDPLQFNGTDYDMNGYYSNPRFTASLNGVYMVSTGAYIRNNGGDALPFHIEKNGSMVRRMPLYAMAEHDSNRRTTSHMVFFLLLDRGDEITINRNVSDPHYRGDYPSGDIGRMAYMSACLLMRSGVRASGGNSVFKIGGYVVHVFTEDGKFEVSRATLGSVVVLMVGGGGGAPSTGSDTAGGGAGGLILHPGMSIGKGSYDVVVGSGGDNDGGNGGDSTFRDLRALGGGGTPGNGDGTDGGSGSGAGRNSGDGGRGLQPDQSGDSGTYGYGKDGGDNSGDGSEGAGGGGAGERGSTVTDVGDKEEGVVVKRGGNGMNMASYFGTNVGDEGWFAGGGGGGGARGSGSMFETGGGKGGGGRGGHPYWDRDGGNGQSNTGGGGGGADNGTGGRGGSGVVIIRYAELLDDDFIEDDLLQVFTVAEEAGALDGADINTPIAVYAARRLFRSYSGPQVRIFRRDNGLRANVYFDSNGGISFVSWENGKTSRELDLSDRDYMVDRLYNQGSGGPIFDMKGYIDGGTLENPDPDTHIYIDQSDSTIVIEFEKGSQTFQFGIDRDRVPETNGTNVMSLYINDDSNNGSSFHAPDVSLEDEQPREGNTRRRGEEVFHTIDIPANRAVLAGLQYRTGSEDRAAQKMHTLVIDDNSESIASEIMSL